MCLHHGWECSGGSSPFGGALWDDTCSIYFPILSFVTLCQQPSLHPLPIYGKYPMNCCATGYDCFSVVPSTLKQYLKLLWENKHQPGSRLLCLVCSISNSNFGSADLMTDYSEQVFSAWQFWWVPTNVIIGASNLLQFCEKWRCDGIWPSDWELEWCLYGWFLHGPSFHASHSCSLKWKVPRILSYLLIWEVCRVSFTQQSNSWWKSTNIM